ncbi:MAG: homocysteine S-methyltransferase [Caldilineaceae bacterium SB0665_bin_25]|nr:homocysteine S-methyltransferase [Caldilineaceae bacterium SB0665_bin_25]
MTPGDPLEPFLAEQGVVILDGALATELERRGADLRDALWSARLLIDDPELIRQLHLDYFLAGADIAISASYQASFEGFARRGLNRKESAELLQRSVRIAQQARDRFWNELRVPAARAGRKRPMVAASVGSFGAYLADGSEYRGSYGISNQELKAWHRPRLEALLAAEPDLLACETIPCFQEGKVLVDLLDEYRDRPAWLSFSCRNEEEVCGGEDFGSCAELANSCPAVVAVGLNCTAPRFAEPLLQKAREKTDKPLVCYPNSGELWDSASHSWSAGNGPAHLAELAGSWKAAGASIIGGCCRTSPSDIRALRARLLPSGDQDALD